MGICTVYMQEGNTLLMMAVQLDWMDVAKNLLHNGADPYARNQVFTTKIFGYFLS